MTDQLPDGPEAAAEEPKGTAEQPETATGAEAPAARPEAIAAGPEAPAARPEAPAARPEATAAGPEAAAAQQPSDGGEAATGADEPVPGAGQPGRSLLGDLVDHGVYAPLGAAVRVAGSLPNLVEKGVSRVGGRISTARVVGRFAVNHARRRAADALSTPPAGRASARPGAEMPPQAHRVGADQSLAASVSLRGLERRSDALWVFDDDGRYRGSPAAPKELRTAGDPAAGALEVGAPEPEPASSATASGPVPGMPPPANEQRAPEAPQLPGVDELAIPNYDSLAASQVVPRLASLSAGELESVRRHEMANRRRMTVLNRVAQLLQDSALVPATELIGGGPGDPHSAGFTGHPAHPAQPAATGPTAPPTGDGGEAMLATASQLSRLVELAAQAVAEAAGRRGGPLLLAASRVAVPEAALVHYLGADDHLLLAGSFAGVVVGLAAAHLEPCDDGVVGVLDLVYVEPDARRVGVGDALLDSLTAWAEAEGCTGLDMAVLPGDQASKAFLETWGFTARLLTLHRPAKARPGRGDAEPAQQAVPDSMPAAPAAAAPAAAGAAAGGEAAGGDAEWPSSEWLSAVPCAGAVVLDTGRLLLVRRANPPDAGLWSLPGGRIEPGEEPAEAAARETLEETGCLVVVGALAGRALIPSERVSYAVEDFFARLADPAAQPMAGGDASEARFVRLDEVLGMDLVTGLGDWLSRHGVLQTGS